VVQSDDVNPDFIELWRDLGLATVSPNIYLMPEFVLPAIRHLTNNEPPRFAVVWNSNQTSMLAIAVFDIGEPNWKFPYSHLNASKWKHSYQSGILLRQGYESEALDCMFDDLLDGPWRAFSFNELREDTAFHQRLQKVAARRGLTWFILKRYQRAGLTSADRKRWRNYVTASRHKNLKKAKARLLEIDSVDLRVLFDDEISDIDISNFLRLEAMGWKGKSSLLSSRLESEFFNELVDACRSHRQIWICELLVGDAVIASTVGFHIADAGFAFKIGMDPAYAKFAPGYLLEYGFLEDFEYNESPLREIESGAQADSFIEALWPTRVPIVSGHFVVGRLPTAYAALMRSLRYCYRYLASWRRADPRKS